MTKGLWTPSEARISASLLAKFMTGYGPFDGYDAVWEWPGADRGAFWSAVWESCGVVGRSGETVLSPGDHMIDDRFFPEARLNYAENLLRHDLPGPALIGHAEDPAADVGIVAHAVRSSARRRSRPLQQRQISD